MKELLILCILTAFIACSKDENVRTFLDCKEISENYKDYTGQNIECQFYYSLTNYEGDQFIELNSHCADLSRPFVINENCEDICENDPYNKNSACGKYLAGREIIEILLIEK